MTDTLNLDTIRVAGMKMLAALAGVMTLAVLVGTYFEGDGASMLPAAHRVGW